MTGPSRVGSIFEMPANRRTEREFAERVDSAFQPDQAAIARVRATILAQVPQPATVQREVRVRWSGGFLTWRTTALALLLVVAVVTGFAIANLRSAPAGGSIAGVTGPSASASAATVTAEPVDLDQTQASLANVLTTAKSGSASALKTVLVAYETDLNAVATELRKPGANVGAARVQLLAQAKGLASIAPSVTPANAAIFREVSGDLDGLIASLPVAGTPDPGKPANNGHPAATPTPTPTHAPAPTPTPTKHPGKGNGNGNGNAGGNGNGNGNAGGNGNGNGNGNAGGNGNGKGHNKG